MPAERMRRGGIGSRTACGVDRQAAHLGQQRPQDVRRYWTRRWSSARDNDVDLDLVGRSATARHDVVLL